MYDSLVMLCFGRLCRCTTCADQLAACYFALGLSLASEWVICSSSRCVCYAAGQSAEPSFNEVQMGPVLPNTAHASHLGSGAQLSIHDIVCCHVLKYLPRDPGDGCACRGDLVDHIKQPEALAQRAASCSKWVLFGVRGGCIHQLGHKQASLRDQPSCCLPCCVRSCTSGMLMEVPFSCAASSLHREGGIGGGTSGCYILPDHSRVMTGLTSALHL
jgi:hypothetical protein